MFGSEIHKFCFYWVFEMWIPLLIPLETTPRNLNCNWLNKIKNLDIHAKCNSGFGSLRAHSSLGSFLRYFLFIFFWDRLFFLSFSCSSVLQINSWNQMPLYFTIINIQIYLHMKEHLSGVWMSFLLSYFNI